MCHICAVTGIRTCDPDEAAIKCELCGYCKAKRQREAALGKVLKKD